MNAMHHHTATVIGAGAIGLAALLVGCDNATEPQAQIEPAVTTATAEVTQPTAATIETPAGPEQLKQEALERKTEVAGATRKPADDGSGPRLTFEAIEHDFGVVYDANPLKHTFVFKNTGDAELEITRVSPSCGCTTTKMDKTIFAPGESAEIETVYTPKGPGRASKYITVQSNDDSESAIRLKISAELIPFAFVEPPRLQMGQIKSGEAHKGLFTVLSRDKDFEIEEIICDSPVLSFSTEGEPTEGKNGQFRQKIIATFNERLPSGAINQQLTFKIRATPPGATESKIFDVKAHIFAMVRGDLSTSPRFIRVNRTEPNEPFEARTRLFTESGLPFTIERIEVENSTVEDIEPTFVEVPEEEGGGYWLIIKGTTGEKAGAFRGTLIVHHNLESEGPLSVVFNGITRRTNAAIDRGTLPAGTQRKY